MSPLHDRSLQDRIAAAVADVERRVAAACPCASAAAEVRAGAHRIRSALTPVHNLELIEDQLGAEGQAALADARAALGRALEGLDELVARVRGLQPSFSLAGELEGFRGDFGGFEVLGSPLILRATLEVLVAEGGAHVRRQACIEGGWAQLTLTAEQPFETQGFAIGVARRLLPWLNGELSTRGGVTLRLPGRCQAKSQRCLLIVDDEPDLAQMFRRFLKRHFEEILEARTAAQAEELLTRRVVTHLVVDSALPSSMPGEALVQRWRSAAPSVRYVALFSGSTALKDARLPGVDGVFIKPNGFDALIELLRKSEPS